MVKREYLKLSQSSRSVGNSKRLCREVHPLDAAKLEGNLLSARMLTGSRPARLDQTMSSGSQLERIEDPRGHSAGSAAKSRARPRVRFEPIRPAALEREIPITIHPRLRRPERVVAAVGELSKLETNAVYPETLKSYIDALMALNTVRD